ncbi:zinc finger protein 675-like [Drosophila innubila]|uniref:zinc finger protein 675-like n=1 Tax=Drosophila innubila TaxID=198719 RepID=UPI00148C401D|nr:zinc finger protein 675-like [Drosophila innubila]
MSEDTPPSIHTICRTCLSNLQEDESFDLFVVPDLAKKLCVCTSLSVEHLDGFPRNLCTTCHSRLNDLHDFQKQCVESVQRFKELMSRNTFIIQTMPEEDAVTEKEHINFDPLLNTKMEIDNEEDVFKMLEDVDKESDDVDNLEDAFNDSGSDYNNEDADFQVDSSDSDDEMPLSSLRSNSKTTKSKAKKVDKNKPKEKPKRKRVPAAERHLHRTIECHICNQKFIKSSCYEEHMKHHNDQLPFQCSVEKCKKGFTTSTGLKHHMEHTHTELCDLHPCTVEGCSESFAQTRMLTQHLRKVHNIAKPIIHPCPECDKVFRCPMALKKHMYDHTGEELPFGCNICQKRYRVNTELRDHLLRHAGIKNFVCPYCGVGKTTKQELDKHMLTHTKEKKFKCDQCDHTSSSKQRMSKHIKVVHLKIKDFVCQYCPKSFSTAYDCKIHERLHTRNNCFECTICGRNFLFESRLTKHLRTHEKRKIKSATSSKKSETDGDAQKDSNEPESVMKVPEIPPKPRDPRRVEVVDMSQLAGTAVNPFPSVSLSSWSTQEDFNKNEGQHTCPECGKNFNKIAGLKLHIKTVHDKVKDFACRFCPKRFSKSYHLRHHEYTHTGEKPYECKVCNQNFRHDATLRKHMESHNRPRKEPKEPKKPKPKPKDPSTDPPVPRVRLNTEPVKNYEQYQDPDAERAAATAQLMAHQLEESEAMRKAEAKTREIQEAACEQLQKLQQQPISYDNFTK